MKKLEISDRGLKLFEDGEMINQGLYAQEAEIPKEIREILSIYDGTDTILLKYKMDLDDVIKSEIKQSIENLGWKIKRKKDIDIKLAYIFIIIFIFECLIGFPIFFYQLNIQNKIIKLKEQKIILKKEVAGINQKINKQNLPVEEEILFEKSEISNYLIFFSEISKKTGVKFKKIEFTEQKINIEGTGNSFSSVFKMKEYLEKYKNIDFSTFDFVKREGEILYFLIELKVN